MNMKAVVIKSPGVYSVEQVPVPHPSEGEVLLKIEACALCGTDQRVLSGEKIVDVQINGASAIVFYRNHFKSQLRNYRG